MPQQTGEGEDERLRAIEEQVNRLQSALASLAQAVEDIRKGLALITLWMPTVSFSDDGKRATLAGKCDDRYYIINKPNGAQHTLKWPKNSGKCALEIVSLDADRKVMEKSALPLEPGQTAESYTNAAGARWTVFHCFGTERTREEDCKLEIDR